MSMSFGDDAVAQFSSPRLVKALAEARRPEGMSEGEEIIHDFCFELSRTGRVKNRSRKCRRGTGAVS